MSITAALPEASTDDAEASANKPRNEGESAQAPAEGADDVSPPADGSAKG